MKVLLISHLFPNSQNPVAGIWLHRMVRGCRKLGHDVRVINPDRFGRSGSGRLRRYMRYVFRGLVECSGQFSARRPVDPTIPSWHPSHYSSRFLPAHWKHLPRQWAIAAAFRKANRSGFRPDLLHCVTSYHCGVPSLPLIRGLGLPLVVTEISSPYTLETMPPYKKKRAQKVLELASKVVATSPFMEREVIWEFPFVKSKICRVYFPTSDDLFARVRAPFKGGPWQLLTVCFLSEQKGLIYMLKAVRLLKNQAFPVRWTIAGDGSLLQFLRKEAIQLGVDDCVQFLGYTPNEKLGELFEKSHFFVIPSLHETQCVALIEAISSGLPSIYTLCGGPEDYMQESLGIGVPPKNPEALAAAVKEGTARFSQFKIAVLKKFAKDHFSEEVIARQMCEIYAKVIQS